MSSSTTSGASRATAASASAPSPGLSDDLERVELQQFAHG